MTSFLTDAANAVARDPNKPTEAEIEAYLNDIQSSLRALPRITECGDQAYHSTMHEAAIQGKNYMWRSAVAAGAQAKYDVLNVATNFGSILKEGNLIVLEVSRPTSPTSKTGIEIKTNFSRCNFIDGRRLGSLPLDNDEARYVPVRGTWSERAKVLQEFARLLIEFGSPDISKALRPVEVPVNALADAAREQKPR